MKLKLTGFAFLCSAALMTGCGAIKDKANQVANDINLPGHWLMVKSENGGTVEKALENESMVLTFKDSKAAFSPTDTLKGRAVFALLSRCTAGPRPYRTEKHLIVFEAVAGCEEKRVSVERLDDATFKFLDPSDSKTMRTLVRIDEAKYQALITPGDRKP